MQVILYTYLIFNVFIRYCAAQDDPAPDPAPEPAPEDVPPVPADNNEAENTAGGDGDQQKQNSNEFKRYLIEDNYRNPIFGSYKYDPIMQQFETTPASENTESKAQSTLAGSEDTKTASPGEAPPAGGGGEAPPPEGDGTPPGSDTPPEANRLRDRLKSMHGGAGKVPLSHWWARARPLPDLKSLNSSLGNTI